MMAVGSTPTEAAILAASLEAETLVLSSSAILAAKASRSATAFSSETPRAEREASLVTRSALMAVSSSTAPTVNFSTVARRSSRSAVNAWARRSAVESWSSIVILTLLLVETADSSSSCLTLASAQSAVRMMSPEVGPPHRAQATAPAPGKSSESGSFLGASMSGRCRLNHGPIRRTLSSDTEPLAMSRASASVWSVTPSPDSPSLCH